MADMATRKVVGDRPQAEPLYSMDSTARALSWVTQHEVAVNYEAVGILWLADGAPETSSGFCSEFAAQVLPLPGNCLSELAVRMFLAHVVVFRRVTLGFHPDVLFEDYVFADGAGAMFGDAECAMYDRLMNQAYLTVGEASVFQMYGDLLEALWPGTDVRRP